MNRILIRSFRKFSGLSKQKIPSSNLSPLNIEDLYKEQPFPIKFEGFQMSFEQKLSFSFNQILSQSQVSPLLLADFLKKIFFGAIQATIDEDKEFLDEYCEELYVDKATKAVKFYKEKGYQFKFVEDDFGDFGAPIPSLAETLDAMIFRGLSSNRKENGKISDYSIWKDQDDMGLTMFTPKKLQDPLNFREKVSETFYDDYKKAVLRILLRIKSPLLLKVYDAEGKEVFVPTKKQTWSHVALFESDLIPAPFLKSKTKLENLQEWLMKYQLGKWKLVDSDNFMLGNPLFLETHSNNAYSDPIFKGTDLDPELASNIRNL